MKKQNQKRGQVSIFIIIAVIIIALAGLFYAFYPQIKSSFISGINLFTSFSILFRASVTNHK